MNTGDALIVIKVAEPQTTKEGAQDDPKRQKRERKDHSSNHDRNKRRDDKTQKMVNFTPLVMPIDQVLMQIKDGHQLRWQKSLSNSPNARNKKKYCRYHRDHGHYMDKCRDLKGQSKRFGPDRKTSLKTTTSHKND